MRRILLAGSALAGGVFLSGAALAEAPKVTFSGSTDYYLRVTDFDAPTGGTGAAGPGWDINQQDDASELIWDVNATADNGLQFGANIQLRYAGTATTDEAWVDFAGSWGRVVLGDDDGVLDNSQVDGVAALPLGAYDTGRFTGSLANPAGWASSTGPAGSVGEASADASKIAYYSPSFAGFSVAVSATPDTGSTFGADNSGATTAYENVFEGTVNYAGEFSGVGVAAYAGYATGSSFAANGASRDDLDAWQLGGTVSMAGFTLGLGYGDSNDSGCLTSQAACDAGKFFNAGVSYNFGPGAVGVGYATTFDAKTTGTEMEAEYYSVEGSYTIAQGLTGYGGVMLATRDNNAATNSEADSTIFVLGTRVNF